MFCYRKMSKSLWSLTSNALKYSQVQPTFPITSKLPIKWKLTHLP